MDGLQISITNFSKLPWQRNNWGVGAGQSDSVNWADEVTQTPAESLKAMNGATVAAANSAHLAFIAKDALFMRLGYGSSDGNFAVELQQLFHLFGIGPQTQWLYWDNGWTHRTTDTTPHTWTFGSTEVLAIPSLSDSGGSIDITISDRAA